ncbi:MAG: hypothetical protein C0599_02635 [Salinivirgaceae bacterium]|nr:MAG: hypothetical protein C0599_02635 [Salinivirgaceae bacterium]
MKKQLYAFAVIISIISFSKASFGQNDSAVLDIKDRAQSIKQLLGDLKNYHIGHYGTTQNCVAYDVYALKYKWYWFLFIKQEENISLMMVRPPLKDKNIDYPSLFFSEGVARAYFHKYIKFKKRRKKVIDMHIYGFYKLNRFGRRAIKNLLLLEYPYYNRGFLKWQLNEEKAKKKAEKKAAKEAAKQAKIDAVESIKPTISKVPIEAK